MTHGKKLPFFSDCVSWPKDRIDLLHALIDQSNEITLSEFGDSIGAHALSSLSRGLGYNSSIPLESDYHVRYARHPDGPVMMVHSAIEHVFGTEEQFRSIECRLQDEISDEALILVHPGSMCGSARMHMGRAEADAARYDVIDRVRNHEGPFFVIDGALSDELSKEEQGVINDAVTRALSKGLPAGRLWGCDSGEKPFPGWTGEVGPLTSFVFDDQMEAAALIAPYLSGFRIFVTGAWAGSNDQDGCVNSVANEIREVLGRNAQVGIDETALPVPEEYEDPSP